jgi:iron complex outermembrane receptor protein
VQDEKTGALTVKRDSDPNAPGVAPTGSDHPEKAGKIESGKVVFEKYEITAKKIDGLNNKGLLQAGRDAALYHDVVTRQDIERMGVSSIQELFRYMPQTSSATTSLQGPVSNPRTTGGLINKTSTVGLRGFSSSQTVVLVNGRALPRSSFGSDGGADIDRIPLAAIERVEVLPYSGSAIYGAGAIGGAINVILRKEYSGQDLTTYVGTSTEGGATEFRFTYLNGLSFNKGKTNLTLTLNYQHRDPLRANQRDYLDDALARYGPDSTAVDVNGQRLFETLILPAFAGAPATILAQSGVADLGIPGAPGVRYAAIPGGTTNEQSLVLSPGSFAGTAGKPTLQPRYGRSILYEPTDSYGVNAQLEHEFVKDKLTGYGEFTLGYNDKSYSMPQGLVIYLTATDPLNPFRTNITPGFVGRPVTVYLDTPDLPDASVEYRGEAARAVLGLKGKISERWEWSVDGVIDYSHNTADSINPVTDLTNLTALNPFADPGPPAPAETRRAIYPIFADHSQYPISEADAAKYFGDARYSGAHGTQAEGNARVMGTVFDLPAGAVRVSGVARYQHWDFVSGQTVGGSNATSMLIHGVPIDPAPDSTPGSRKIWQGALELTVPVITSKWRPLPVESFEIEASMAKERDTSSSVNSNDEPFSNEQSATSGVLAGRLQVTRDVAFRASYSEGFYPPNWQDVGSPVSSFSIPGFFPDPKRGNTMQFTPSMDIMQGGNPDLRPETAESENYGIILTPRFLPSFSLNVDYWKIHKEDAIVSQSFVNIIANPDAFGFLITRQPPDASDIAKGWEGRITAVDARAFNASVVDTEGFDVRVRYLLETDSAGSFDLTAGGSFTDTFKLSATPTAPIINTVDGSGPISWRANGSLTWSKSAWSTTLTGRYIGAHSGPTTDPSESFPGASGIDGAELPSYLHWDLQVTYEIPYRGAATRDWRSWFGGTKWTLGALNVLNDKPAFVSDGYSFYDSADDPRQRYVYVQIRKSF